MDMIHKFRISKDEKKVKDLQEKVPIPAEIASGKKVMFGGGDVPGKQELKEIPPTKGGDQLLTKGNKKKENVPGKQELKEIPPTKGGDQLGKIGGVEKSSKAAKKESKNNEVPTLHVSKKGNEVVAKEDSKQRTKSYQPDPHKMETSEKHSRSKSDVVSSMNLITAEEKEKEGIEKKTKQLKAQETIITKRDESRIPTSHTKKPNSDPAKRIEHTLQQLGTLKTRLRQELKTRSSKQRVEELNMDNIDFKDEGALRDKLLEMHRNNILLKKQVTELNSHNSTLQNRLLKEQEKGKLHPKVTTIVPTSLEANMHLRYQFQKNLEKERKKYSQLLLENERLALEVKEANLENIKKRKTKTLETSISHNAEIVNWKAKVRELELDNLQLLEIITKREQELTKVVKEKEYIYNEMVTMRRLHMHLSNRIDNDNTEYNLNSNLGSRDLKEEEVVAEEPNDQLPAIPATDDVPHYAQKIKRENAFKIRDGNKKLIAASKIVAVKKMTQRKLVESINHTIDTHTDNTHTTFSEDDEQKSKPNGRKSNPLKSTEAQSISNHEANGEISTIKPTTHVKRSKAKSETPFKTADILDKGNESMPKKERAATNIKEKNMKDAKIRLEFESYVGHGDSLLKLTDSQKEVKPIII